MQTLSYMFGNQFYFMIILLQVKLIFKCTLRWFSTMTCYFLNVRNYELEHAQNLLINSLFHDNIFWVFSDVSFLSLLGNKQVHIEYYKLWIIKTQ